MFTSAVRLRGFSLTTICLSLLFIGGLNGTINTTQAQARAYVPNSCNNTVAVIDTRTNAVITTIPVGSEPFIPAVTPDGARVYVSSGTPPGTVAVIDTTTNTVFAEIAGIECSNGIAIAPPQFPQSKDDCKDSGYQRFGPPAFRNQGQCLKYVKEHAN